MMPESFSPAISESEILEIPIRVGPDGQMPRYASLLSAGCDLFAAAAVVIRPGETVCIPLDFVMALPPGTEAQIRPRSGLSLKTDLRVPNAPGTIDADYRHPVGVLLQNTFNPAHLPYEIARRPELLTEILKTHRAVRLADCLGSLPESAGLLSDLQPLLETTLFLDAQNNPYGTIYVNKDDRIAQMVVSRCTRAVFIAHEAPETIGYNRGGGFGSTGSR